MKATLVSFRPRAYNPLLRSRHSGAGHTALPSPWAVAGDAPRVVGRRHDTTPPAPGLGLAPQAGAAPHASPDPGADLTWGVPAVGSHSPRRGDGAQAGA
jgi:hypothetical protein